MAVPTAMAERANVVINITIQGSSSSVTVQASGPITIVVNTSATLPVTVGNQSDPVESVINTQAALPPTANDALVPSPAAVDTSANPPAVASTQENSDDTVNLDTPLAIFNDFPDPVTAIFEASNPAYAVLNTPELLEAICSHLPMRTLTRARRVSRFWKEVIDGSVQLRRMLFLVPEEPEFRFCWVKNERAPPRLSHWRPIILLMPYPPRGKIVIKAHPILSMNRVPGTSFSASLDSRMLTWVPPDTFICQPPLQRVRMLICGRIFRKHYFVCDEGLTFGAILEGLKALRRYHDLNEKQRVRVSLACYDPLGADA